MGDPEEDLVAKISETLEIHGYLPKVRAGLKVLALKTAQTLAASHEIQQTDAITRKTFQDNSDLVQLQLCKDLARALNLEKTCEMLAIEASGKAVDLKAAFPAVDSDPKVPMLVSLIERAKAK
jgi:hypothetical protein